MEDYSRLMKLAGIEQVSEKDLEENIRDLAPLQLDQDVPLEDLEFRLDAAKRGIGLANRLRNPEEKKAHLSRVFSNLNKIQGALKRAIKSI